MSLMTRLTKLERAARDIPPAGQINMVVCTPAEMDNEKRPPGEYPSPNGSMIDVVFAGPEPDPVVLTRLQDRMSSHGLMVILHSDAPALHSIPA